MDEYGINNFDRMNEIMEVMKSKGFVDETGNLIESFVFPSEEVMREVLNSRYYLLRQDPLMLRYGNLAVNCGQTGVIINEGWKALGEQKFNAASIACINIPYYYYKNESYFEGKKQAELFDRIRLSTGLSAAQTFVWKREVIDQLKDYPLPSCKISQEILPYPMTYHTFETSIGMDIDNNLNVDWILFCHKPEYGIEVTHNVGERCKDSAYMKVYNGFIKYGMKYPPEKEEYSEKEIKALGFMLSFFAFIKSPYIDVNRQKLPRFIRRNDYKDGDSEREREVSVVQLREDIRERLALYNSESKEWKHRWWVRGHYRNQWYPSTGTHEMVWIAPYIKGKEELPMLEKIYHVNR